MNPTVLIASSDPELSGSLRVLLEQWRYPVAMVEDGMAALTKLTGNSPPEMVLLDSGLRVLSGGEVVREAIARNGKKRSWMILLSRIADAEAVRTATAAGVDDFLLSPVDPLELKVRLRVAERVRELASELEQESAAVLFHASHDSLTGLWNREASLRCLFQETDRVQRMGTPLSVVLLDLDKFARVNSEYGYGVGDGVLRELANRFRRFLRTYDLAGRYGEDEFLLALPGCSLEHAKSMAERLRRQVLQKPFALARDFLVVTASIGIAESLGRSPLTVLREAGDALAAAKLAGRDCVRLRLAERAGDPGWTGANNRDIDPAGGLEPPVRALSRI